MIKKIQQDMIAGTVHKTNARGDLKIVKYTNSSNVSVEFNSTGHIKRAKASNIRAGRVKDQMKRTVFGVGFFGVGPMKSRVGGVATVEYSVWNDMLE